MKDLALGILKKHGIACAAELVLLVALPAVKDYVKNTPNPVDDVIEAALEDSVKKAIADLVAKAA